MAAQATFAAIGVAAQGEDAAGDDAGQAREREQARALLGQDAHYSYTGASVGQVTWSCPGITIVSGCSSRVAPERLERGDEVRAGSTSPRSAAGASTMLRRSAASPVSSTSPPLPRRTSTDWCPGAWPGVEQRTTLPSPNRSIVALNGPSGPRARAVVVEHLAAPDRADDARDVAALADAQAAAVADLPLAAVGDERRVAGEALGAARVVGVQVRHHDHADVGGLTPARSSSTSTS